MYLAFNMPCTQDKIRLSRNDWSEESVIIIERILEVSILNKYDITISVRQARPKCVPLALGPVFKNQFEARDVSVSLNDGTRAIR
jgi:hypothetical protein